MVIARLILSVFSAQRTMLRHTSEFAESCSKGYTSSVDMVLICLIHLWLYEDTVKGRDVAKKQPREEPEGKATQGPSDLTRKDWSNVWAQICAALKYYWQEKEWVRFSNDSDGEDILRKDREMAEECLVVMTRMPGEKGRGSGPEADLAARSVSFPEDLFIALGNFLDSKTRATFPQLVRVISRLEKPFTLRPTDPMRRLEVITELARPGTFQRLDDTGGSTEVSGEDNPARNRWRFVGGLVRAGGFRQHPGLQEDTNDAEDTASEVDHENASEHSEDAATVHSADAALPGGDPPNDDKNTEAEVGSTGLYPAV